MAAEKINQAHEHMANAEKHLKTSFMKWKPDYDSAASEYSKAAVAFKNSKMLEEAKEACLLEAEAHTNNKTLFHAAKALEQAGMMLKVKKPYQRAPVFPPWFNLYWCSEKLEEMKDLGRLVEAVELIERASLMYLENGTPDTAALALDRAGKLIEPQSLAKAVDIYQKAADVYENEERLRQAVEMLGKASRLLVRQHRFDDAAVSIQKEKKMYREIENYPTCFKKTIAQVLVHLHRNDYVAADKCVRESYSVPGFTDSEDCVSLERLLEAYDQQDEETLNRISSSPLFKYMDNDYAKLALALRVPGGGKKKLPAESSVGGASVGEAGPGDDEDEYASGLC